MFCKRAAILPTRIPILEMEQFSHNHSRRAADLTVPMNVHHETAEVGLHGILVHRDIPAPSPNKSGAGPGAFPSVPPCNRLLDLNDEKVVGGDHEAQTYIMI
jgi:hypothetical protein